MADDLNLVTAIELHGDCLVCLHPLDLELPRQEIALLRKDGAFTRFDATGRLRVVDVSILWLHAFHLQ